jgi:hypothetical protein
MVFDTEQSNMPFEVRDCALITRMAGIDTAINLRELRERVAVVPVECLFHHFCETQIRPTFDDPEFSNDFAVWSARNLRDRVLAERLGVINPYTFGNLEELREAVLEIIDDHLSTLPYIPWVPRGEDFRFMAATTVVFNTGKFLATPQDLLDELPRLSDSSIYYHFIEARRRTENRTDDFSAWLQGFGKGCEELINTLGKIDFYYLPLRVLKETIIREASLQPERVSHDR